MSRWGDEQGLMWQDAVKNDRGQSERIVSLPPSTWEPPTELPVLRGKGYKLLSLDTETKDPDLTELGPGFRRGAHVIGLSIGLESGYRAYFPFRHEGGGNMDPDKVQRWMKTELNGFDGELVGANINYDLDGLANEGVTFPNVKAFHDVQVAEPLLDEWRLQYNLDALSHDYLGEGKEQELLERAAMAYGWQTEKQRKSNLYRLHSSYVGPYAEADADRPLRILPLQFKKLEAEDLMPIYHLERKLIPILVAMRRRGVRVDTAKAEKVKVELGKRRDELLAEARRLAGTSKVEFMQPETFYKALEDQGLKVPRTPKTKQPSIKKDFLERYAPVNPLVNAIWQGRKMNTTINTFINGHILGSQTNGRIHCQFNQLKGDDSGTIARFSSSNPNLQNLPARDEEIAPLVRGIFIPEDGEIWQKDDYDQVEYRLLAHYAVGQGADEARRKYSEEPETDFHKYVAGLMGIDPEDKLKRKRVKNVNFAKGYGAKGFRLSQIMNCSVEEATELMEQYDRDLPFAKATFEACQYWMKKRGFVTTILGRKQRCSLWEPMNNWDNPKPPLPYDEALKEYGARIQRYMTYAAMNRKFQGSGADIMKKAMVDAWEAGICDVIGPYLLTVHDELDNSIPQTKAGKEAGQELSNIMSKVVELKVPLTVGTDRGPNWGDCE